MTLNYGILKAYIKEKINKTYSYMSINKIPAHKKHGFRVALSHTHTQNTQPYLQTELYM